MRILSYAFSFLLFLSFVALAPALAPALAQDAPAALNPSVGGVSAEGASAEKGNPNLGVPTPALAAPSAVPAAASVGASVAATNSVKSGAPVGPGPDPQTIPPLKSILDKGGQVYYLGERSGLQGWFLTHEGRIQVLYLTPDKKAVLFGAMFGNEDGENITGDQVQALAEREPNVKQILTTSRDLQAAGARLVASELPKPESAADQLLLDLGTAAGVDVGSKDAPQLLMVVDPYCPHCKATWKMLEPAVSLGRLQVRLIPIGAAGSKNEQAAAVLLASNNAAADWVAHANGDEKILDKTALPQMIEAVRENHAVVDRWKVPATPYIAYRSRTGQVMVVQGKPRDINLLLSDLGAMGATPVPPAGMPAVGAP